MRVLRRAMCMTGRHSGAWSLPGRGCEIVRTCDVCGAAEERTRHRWGPFTYRDDGRCTETRRCERCGSAESRTSHEWGPWRYLDEELVTAQTRTCRRCRQTERTRRFSTL